MKLNFGFIFFLISQIYAASGREFPPNFRFGTATSAYQVEGAWNSNDKGESTWDHFTHTKPDKIKDHTTGDVACDSYHLYKRDVEMLTEIGVDFYRFSISWTRILPGGFSNKISKHGLRYYDDLINELIKRNIEPMVTIFHWDTPQVFERMGGWTNPLIVDYYADYARILFELFGDRVKEWVTFNEPFNMCNFGYGTRKGFLTLAPDIDLPGTGEYQCVHNVIKAHAKVYHIYDEEFRSKQKGKIGMANVIIWPEPESNKTEDVMLAEKAIQFNNGWITHAIYTKNGDYPDIMKKEIEAISKRQGYPRSRLPKFTQDEIEHIRGTYDFIGVNYYTSVIFGNKVKNPILDVPSFDSDLGYKFYQDSTWEPSASSWLKLRPSGLRDMLNWVRKEYGNREIYILENGYSSKGGLLDFDRINFFNNHLNSVLDAIDDGCNVTLYTAWSLMDNFEWFNGYTERFGLFEVDFSSPKKTRTPRLSMLAYRNIIETRKLNFTHVPELISTKNTADSSTLRFFGYIFIAGGMLIAVLFLWGGIQGWKVCRA